MRFDGGVFFGDFLFGRVVENEFCCCFFVCFVFGNRLLLFINFSSLKKIMFVFFIHFFPQVLGKGGWVKWGGVSWRGRSAPCRH